MPQTKAIKKTKTVPDHDQEPFEIDTITCPKCGQVQEAKIYTERKTFKQLHRCTTCNFLIFKKDWHSIL